MLLTLVVLLSLASSHVQSLDRSAAFVGYSERAEGLPAQGRGGAVMLQTAHGKIEISLMKRNAPHTTAAILQAARLSEKCANCRFYRNEARPEQGSLGPPYGLLQGSLASLDGNFIREGNVVARRGLVCSIPASKEFFIATCDHSEWGTAHTCWGEVIDLTAVESIVATPYKSFTHPDYGTVMRMLKHEVPFQILGVSAL